LSRREFALLRAIAAGRGEITGGCEPDLFIDGLACCDQSAAHHLAHAGLVRATSPVEVGQRVSAELTNPGCAVLTTLADAEWPSCQARTVDLESVTVRDLGAAA
jgi:hypothetical protein